MANTANNSKIAWTIEFEKTQDGKGVIATVRDEHNVMIAQSSPVYSEVTLTHVMEFAAGKWTGVKIKLIQLLP